MVPPGPRDRCLECLRPARHHMDGSWTVYILHFMGEASNLNCILHDMWKDWKAVLKWSPHQAASNSTFQCFMTCFMTRVLRTLIFCCLGSWWILAHLTGQARNRTEAKNHRWQGVLSFTKIFTPLRPSKPMMTSPVASVSYSARTGPGWNGGAGG